MSVDAINALQQGLQQTINNFEIPSQQIGNTQAIIKSVEEVEKIFEGYASASAPIARAYAAALSFLRGRELKDDEYDFITAAIDTPIKEQGGKRIIDSENFLDLLNHYYNQVAKESMWRLSWYWLLLSYFEIDYKSNDLSTKNINQLRKFLFDTHGSFINETGLVPMWVKVLGGHKNLFSSRPCDRYAKAYIDNQNDEINEIKNILKIPIKSWFWHHLTLTVAKYITSLTDDASFKSHLPKMISFIDEHHGYRDEAIKILLERYYKCHDKSVNVILRDYIIRPDVWKNPKLRNTGIASKWQHVDEGVWRMVFGWVTREHLRMFFEIIAGRHGARKDRFSFWLQYVDQITFTKLVFGLTTEMQRQKNIEIKKLFDEEDGVYALLKSSNRELDAFIMQIGKYTFVEFSMNGNAAFIYETSNLHFNMNTRRLSDDDRSLKLRLDEEFKLKTYQKPDNRIIHINDWQSNTKNRLTQLGIFPDHNKQLW